MNDIRARFEEIWPVPDVIFWSNDIGRYAPMPDQVLQYERLNEQWANEHNARLDTFTRCQETTALYVGIIDEMIEDIKYLNVDAYGSMQCPSQELIDRAKQIMGTAK